MSTDTRDEIQLTNDMVVKDSTELVPGMPSTQATSGIKHCAECAKPFKIKNRTHRYCSDTCKSAYNSREALRGQQLYRAMMSGQIYAMENPDSKEDNPYLAYSERLLQMWAIEDMQEGRAPSVKPVV